MLYLRNAISGSTFRLGNLPFSGPLQRARSPLRVLAPLPLSGDRMNTLLPCGPHSRPVSALLRHLLSRAPSAAFPRIPPQALSRSQSPKSQPKQMLLRLPDFCPGIICTAFTGSLDQNSKCPQMTRLKSRRSCAPWQKGGSLPVLGIGHRQLLPGHWRPASAQQ